MWKSLYNSSISFIFILYSLSLSSVCKIPRYAGLFIILINCIFKYSFIKFSVFEDKLLERNSELFGSDSSISSLAVILMISISGISSSLVWTSSLVVWVCGVIQSARLPSNSRKNPNIPLPLPPICPWILLLFNKFL